MTPSAVSPMPYWWVSGAPLRCPQFFFFFFQVQPYNRKYRSIGHRVWSMSLNILTELSVNSFNEKHNSAEPLAHAQSVIVMQF